MPCTLANPCGGQIVNTLTRPDGAKLWECLLNAHSFLTDLPPPRPVAPLPGEMCGWCTRSGNEGACTHSKPGRKPRRACQWCRSAKDKVCVRHGGLGQYEKKRRRHYSRRRGQDSTSMTRAWRGEAVARA